MEYNISYDTVGFGNELKYYRLQNDLNQNELCSLLSISKQSYINIEQGKNKANIEVILKLSNIFKLDFMRIILLRYRHDTTPELIALENKINKLSFEGSINQVESIMAQIEKLLLTKEVTSDKKLQLRLKQLIILCECTKYIDKEDLISTIKLQKLAREGLELTGTKLNKKVRFKKNYFISEYRLMNAYAASLFNSDLFDEAFEFMEFIIDELKEVINYNKRANTLYLIAMQNYANMLYIVAEDELAEGLCDRIIEHQSVYKDKGILRLTFSLKGYIRFQQSAPDYKKYFIKAFKLTSLPEDNVIYEEMIENLKANGISYQDILKEVSQ